MATLSKAVFPSGASCDRWDECLSRRGQKLCESAIAAYLSTPTMSILAPTSLGPPYGSGMAAETRRPLVFHAAMGPLKQRLPQALKQKKVRCYKFLGEATPCVGSFAKRPDRTSCTAVQSADEADGVAVAKARHQVFKLWPVINLVGGCWSSVKPKLLQIFRPNANAYLMPRVGDVS